jgi:hypothetical protein
MSGPFADMLVFFFFFTIGGFPVVKSISAEDFFVPLFPPFGVTFGGLRGDFFLLFFDFGLGGRNSS